MPQRGLRSIRARAFTTLLAVVTLLAIAGAGASRPAVADTPALGAAVVNAPAVPAPVVVIGVPALLWSDVTETGTPALWRLTGEGSAAALSVRTTTRTTCPADAWLSVSAGQRARLAGGDCGPPPAPVPAGDGDTVVVPNWSEIVDDNARTSYRARLGLLAETVRSAGPAKTSGANESGESDESGGYGGSGRNCTMAVGPGAAYGAADAGGRVDTYFPSAAQVPDGGWTQCTLALVEVDALLRAHQDDGAQVQPSGAERAAAARRADRAIAGVLSALPAGTTVLLAGISDTIGESHLHVALARTLPGGTPGSTAGEVYGGGFMTANSTRQPALVTLTDITATALDAAGLPRPEAAIGAVWTPEPADATTAEKVATLHDHDVAAQAVSSVQPAYFVALFAGQLLLYGAAALALRRRPPEDGRRRTILIATRVVALLGASAPVASFLANLLPWWKSDHPVWALIAGVLAMMTLVTGLALAGPWRRSILGPGLVIAGLTATVLAVEAFLGAPLQMNGLMGFTALVAGRFYGFGNQAFALFAVAAILTAAWLAEHPLRHGRRGTAIGIVAVIGVIAVALDGWPAWGSDFGGVLAMVPAFAVLGLLISGRRVSVWWLGAFCLAGVVLVLSISYADSLRAAPSHLGRFWDDLVGGEAGGVVLRKAQAMLRSLGYWPFTIAAIGALLFLFAVLARPMQWRAAILDRTYQRTLTLRPALISVLVVAVAGMLVNDSGVVIPAVVFSLATPLALAAGVRALELDSRPELAAAGPEPAGADTEETG